MAGDSDSTQRYHDYRASVHECRVPLPESFAQTCPFVTSEWVESQLEVPELRIVDVRRTGLNDPYGIGHIPRAIRVHLEQAILTPNGCSIVSLVQFAGAMSQHGLGDDHFIVVYDLTGDYRANVLVWALQRFGHSRVASLSGGYSQWLREGRCTEVQATALPLASFTARDLGRDHAE